MGGECGVVRHEDGSGERVACLLGRRRRIERLGTYGLGEPEEVEPIGRIDQNLGMP